MHAAPVHEVSPQPATQATIEAAILKTVAYVDMFDYPLTAGEVQRYLAGVAAPAAAVTAVLSNGCLVPRRLSRHEGYFTLPGREDIVATRRQREAVAQHLWPEAIGYGRLIANLPFVRMVAVTGSLAVNNVEPDADIDYLVVTENERLWLARALVIVVVRLAARRNVRLCPNYFLSRRALVFPERSLYTAHELVQMRPIAGLDIYHLLRRLNAWTADFLPNAHLEQPSSAAVTAAEPAKAKWRQAAEAMLRTRAGAPIERWEMRRKIRKFGRAYTYQNGNYDASEAAFSADWCKGHFDGHGRRIMETFAGRLLEIGD
jgi:hypothetical protein